jgi:hypothetical protein
MDMFFSVARQLVGTVDYDWQDKVRFLFNVYPCKDSPSGIRIDPSLAVEPQPGISYTRQGSSAKTLNLLVNSLRALLTDFDKEEKAPPGTGRHYVLKRAAQAPAWITEVIKLRKIFPAVTRMELSSGSGLFPPGYIAKQRWVGLNTILIQPEFTLEAKPIRCLSMPDFSAAIQDRIVLINRLLDHKEQTTQASAINTCPI